MISELHAVYSSLVNLTLIMSTASLKMVFDAITGAPGRRDVGV